MVIRTGAARALNQWTHCWTPMGGIWVMMCRQVYVEETFKRCVFWRLSDATWHVCIACLHRCAQWGQAKVICGMVSGAFCHTSSTYFDVWHALGPLAKHTGKS